jgi:hypothetical protein
MFWLLILRVYSSTGKKEETCYSETSVDFQRTAWHYIPEDRNLHHSLRWLFNDAVSIDDKKINETVAVVRIITGRGNRNIRRTTRHNANLSI